MFLRRFDIFGCSEMLVSTLEAVHRNVIKLCKELGMTLSVTHKKLKYIESHRTVSRALVFKWHKIYTYGFKETKQKKRGRPMEIDDNVYVRPKLKNISMFPPMRPIQLNPADRFFFITLNRDLRNQSLLKFVLRRLTFFFFLVLQSFS